eukprot:2478400-Rhodomonas_salina.3
MSGTDFVYHTRCPVLPLAIRHTLQSIIRGVPYGVPYCVPYWPRLQAHVTSGTDPGYYTRCPVLTQAIRYTLEWENTATEIGYTATEKGYIALGYAATDLGYQVHFGVGEHCAART